MASKTYSAVVEGDEYAARVVAGLVEASVWFTFEPCPDGEYEITVKVESTRLLQGEIMRAKKAGGQ